MIKWFNHISFSKEKLDDINHLNFYDIPLEFKEKLRESVWSRTLSITH